jgi:gamma-glutamyltranspeptidase / glutathione hydrolase
MSFKRKQPLIALLGLITLASCTPTGAGPAAIKEASWQGGTMVASANPLASEAGMEILRKGGSAVDAAIAVQAVLSLVEPQSSGLGGGAFLLHFDRGTGTITAYDGRETAPMAADETLFLGDDGQPLGFLDAKISGRAVGVPGVTDMLALAHKDHGALLWSDLFGAAIGLAEVGFAVSPRMAESLVVADRFGLRRQPELSAYFSDEHGELIAERHRLTNPDYATSLRALSANPRAFYEPPYSSMFITASQAEPMPGAMTQADFDDYRARRHEPLCTDYRGYRVCGHPMPSSGGLGVAQVLEIVERIGWGEGGLDTAENRARFAEAQRLAYADRDAFAADDTQVDVPVSTLLSEAYLDGRAALVTPGQGAGEVVAGDPYGTGAPRTEPGHDTPGTSHFVVVDREGDVVSMTTTVESVFGSFRMAGGMILNNQMTDFDFAPTRADGTPAPNRPGPGKRPRSTMAPTIVLDEKGAFHFATGSPGGSSIIAYTTKSLIGVLDFGMTPQDAAAFPNIVARGMVRVEPSPQTEGWEDEFAARGFPTAPSRGEISGIHSVLFLKPEGVLSGAADPRREGSVEAG